MLARKLMRTVRIMLRGSPFFGLLLRQVMADDAAADRAHDGMVARVVTGYTAHDCAFYAAGGVCAAGRRQTEGGGSNEQTDFLMVFHDLGLRDI